MANNIEARKPRNIHDILGELTNVRQLGNGKYQADCPVPGHQTPKHHLSVGDGGDKGLVTCFCKHSYQEICGALGYESLCYGKDTQRKQESNIVATYDYTDENGKLLYQVVRYFPKDFRQRRPDGKGGWIWNLDAVTPVLFQLPDIMNAVRWGDTIFICEGEKDALHIWGIGLIGTCNSGGAGQWRPEFAEVLQGAKVVVIPHRDGAGIRHAKQIADSLYGKATSLKILEMPDINGKRVKDFTDWLLAGSDWIHFDELVETKAIQHYKPGTWPKAILHARGAVL